MLMVKRPSSPLHPGARQVAALHDDQRVGVGRRPRARDLDAVDAGKLHVVLGRGVGVDDADLLAERLEREGHRQLRADRVAVRPRVGGEQETLPAQDRVADLVARCVRSGFADMLFTTSSWPGRRHRDRRCRAGAGAASVPR